MIHVLRSEICIVKWRVERLLRQRNAEWLHRRQNWLGRRGGYGKQVSSRSYLQIIGTATDSTSPSIYLFTDSQRYFFNCGENTIKLFFELNKSFDATKIFLTRLSWTETLAGLPLACRYLNRSGRLEQHVFGPREAANLIKSTSIFSRTLYNLNRDVSLRFTGYSTKSAPVYADDNITITPIVLDVREGKVNSSLCRDLSVCYLCEFSDMPGNLLKEKVKEHGLTTECCRSLLAGKTVTTASGMQVSPSDMMTSSTPGQKFMIVDCPSLEIRDELVTNEEIIPQEKPLTLVVHLTPKDIIDSKPYRSWMEKLGGSTKHIFLNRTSPIAHSPFQKDRELLSRLHAVSPNSFPDLNHSNTQDEIHDLSSNFVQGKNLLTYHFRPLKMEGMCRTLIPAKYDLNKFTEQADKQMVAFKKKHVAKVQDIDVDFSSFSDSQVTFLGTGSSTPSVFRNNSAILLKISPTKLMMLDCGEGAYAQLHRMYRDKTCDVLRSLSCVFISHKHADHHIGLVRMLLERQHFDHKVEPLCIVGPKRIQDWLMECSAIESDLHFRYVTFTELKASGAEPCIGDVLSELELTKFQVVPVVHCADSHGLVLEHSSGWKLVYSGDCRPSDALVQAGEDATLLIHEATFLEQYNKDSIETQHSTISEAVDVSSRMRAKFTILTHLSLNRAQYHPRRIGSLRLPPGVSTAFDFMTVRLRELPSLHKIRPAISHVMKEPFLHEVKKAKSDTREEVGPRPEKCAPKEGQI